MFPFVALDTPFWIGPEQLAPPLRSIIVAFLHFDSGMPESGLFESEEEMW